MRIVTGTFIFVLGSLLNVCLAQWCTVPEIPNAIIEVTDNGREVPGGGRVRNEKSVRIICTAPSVLKGAGTSTCDIGDWDTPLGTCETPLVRNVKVKFVLKSVWYQVLTFISLQCTVPVLENGSYNLYGNISSIAPGTLVNEQQAIVPSCRVGYILMTPLGQRRPCQADETWGGDEPSCELSNPGRSDTEYYYSPECMFKPK